MLYSVLNVSTDGKGKKMKLQGSCVTAGFFQSGMLRLG